MKNRRGTTGSIFLDHASRTLHMRFAHIARAKNRKRSMAGQVSSDRQ
jgi:hypothetical protein